MNSTKSFFLAAVALAALAAPGSAEAQVGYPPAQSPFRDLEYKQELTLFGGWYKSDDDAAGVTPGSGPILGLRYEIRVGGPAQFMARVATIQTERRAVNPAAPEATRDLGVHDVSQFLIDAGISVNLTGQKSWKRLVPTVNAGVGVVSGDKKVETDPYRFGTPFAFTYGLGLRYVPGGRFAMRLGADAHLYRQQYPAAYYAAAPDGTAVLDEGQSTNFWKNNVALTIGASYLFFR